MPKRKNAPIVRVDGSHALNGAVVRFSDVRKTFTTWFDEQEARAKERASSGRMQELTQMIQLAYSREKRVEASILGWQRNAAWATEQRVIDDVSAYAAWIDEQKNDYLLKVGETGQVFRLPGADAADGGR